MPTKEERFCIDCDTQGIHSRKRCEPCVIIYNKERSRLYYSTHTSTRYGKAKCIICDKEFIKNLPNQRKHGSCKIKEGKYYNDFKRSREGMTIARQEVKDKGIKFEKGYCVHHINESPDDNKFENYMILPIKTHTALHQFIDMNREILIESKIECNEKMIIYITKLFLTMKGFYIKVIFHEDMSIQFKQKQVYIFENSLI